MSKYFNCIFSTLSYRIFSSTTITHTMQSTSLHFSGFDSYNCISLTELCLLQKFTLYLHMSRKTKQRLFIFCENTFVYVTKGPQFENCCWIMNDDNFLVKHCLIQKISNTLKTMRLSILAKKKRHKHECGNITIACEIISYIAAGLLCSGSHDFIWRKVLYFFHLEELFRM